MKKKLITISLVLLILFNSNIKIYATSPEPAAAIPIVVTSGEVYTFLFTTLTYMGIQFKNASDRQKWIEDEYGPYTGNPDGGFYDIIDYQIRKAKAEAKLGGKPPKPEPRQIAIPVPDNLIDDLINRLKDSVIDEDEIEVIPENDLEIVNLLRSKALESNIVGYIIVYNTNGKYELIGVSTTDSSKGYSLRKGNHAALGETYFVNNSDSLDNITKKIRRLYYTTYPNVISDGISYYQTKFITNVYGENDDSIKVTLPKGDFIRNWTSPYTGMQTVTMPLTTTGIESPVEIPVIPDDYVEPAPDEVTNPIQNPEDDPLINPETGLPFIDPETGLPIFPVGPLVPTTPITPIPQPQPLEPGQSIDYRPNLTEIGNDIKQLPEKIVNPIKSLFIPDKISTIDFRPLNVPVVKKFPFCIPWDLRNAVVAFNAPPIPPVFTFSLTFFGKEYPIVWDFVIFEEFAEITRFFVLMGFVVGLILATRGLIKG